jgi:hypothetical protein
VLLALLAQPELPLRVFRLGGRHPAQERFCVPPSEPIVVRADQGIEQFAPVLGRPGGQLNGLGEAEPSLHAGACPQDRRVEVNQDGIGFAEPQVRLRVVGIGLDRPLKVRDRFLELTCKVIVLAVLQGVTRVNLSLS